MQQLCCTFHSLTGRDTCNHLAGTSLSSFFSRYLNTYPLFAGGGGGGGLGLGPLSEAVHCQTHTSGQRHRLPYGVSKKVDVGAKVFIYVLITIH